MMEAACHPAVKWTVNENVTETWTESETESGTGIERGTEEETGTGIGTGTETETEAENEIETEIGTGTEMDRSDVSIRISVILETASNLYKRQRPKIIERIFFLHY